MVKSVKNYLSLVTFAHTVFAMPFALIGFFLGIKYYNNLTGYFSSDKHLTSGAVPTATFDFPKSVPEIITRLLLVVLCMVFARNAAMAFNRYLDRHFDGQNPRTAIREIPNGIISPNSALRFVILNCLLFFSATFLINRMCFYLSPVALFVILFYSYTKRFTWLCHLVLGLGLSLAPIGAFIAVTGRFAVVPVLFALSVLFWVSGFDIIYALQDESFDKANNLHSVPAWLGRQKSLHVSSFLHVLSFAAIVAAGTLGQFSGFYWAGAAIFGFFLIYQHRLVHPNDLSKVNRAFFTSNGIASVVFSVLVLTDIFHTIYF